MPDIPQRSLNFMNCSFPMLRRTADHTVVHPQSIIGQVILRNNRAISPTAEMQRDAKILGMPCAGLHALAGSVVYWGVHPEIRCYNTYDVIRFLALLLQNVADTPVPSQRTLKPHEIIEKPSNKPKPKYPIIHYKE